MADARTIISEAQNYAKTAFEQALPLVENATQAISQYRFVGIGGGVKELEPPERLLLDSKIPEFQPQQFVEPDVPAAPTDFRLVPEMVAGTLPTNKAIKPGYVEPALPTQLRQFNAPPPAIVTSFAFPEPPLQLQNPQLTAPTIGNRTAPTAPTVQLPVFEARRPDSLARPPSDYAEKFEAAYRGMGPTMRSALEAEADGFLSRYNPRYREQLAALEDRLATYIKGGTALSPAVEDAIYSRATRKVNAEYLRTRDTAMGDAARRGFTMPDGALFAAMRQTRQSAADNSTLAATEIAVKQAELEQQNIQFAVTTSSQLRTAMISASLNYHGNLVQINAQALSFAQSILSAMIEVYNTLVKAYTAELDTYRAEASVYEARVRGALALVEVYRAEIAGFSALVDADMSKVRVYQAQIEALNSLATMYRAQVETVVSKASLEKLKLDLFGAQVEAYRSEASAKASEYQGYSAAIAGQEGKLRAYSEEIRAYGQEVDAYRTTVAAKTAEVQGAVSFNEGVVRRYQSATEAYRALVGGRATAITATVETQRSQLLAAQARFGAEESRGKYGIEYYKARSSSNIESYKADVSALIESAKVTTSQLSAIANVSLGGAEVYKGLASAALSGINTLVSQSLTE